MVTNGGKKNKEQNGTRRRKKNLKWSLKSMLFEFAFMSF